MLHQTNYYLSLATCEKVKFVGLYMWHKIRKSQVKIHYSGTGLVSQRLARWCLEHNFRSQELKTVP